MATSVMIACAHCQEPMVLPPEGQNGAELRCAACNIRQVHYVYPAAFQEPLPDVSPVAIEVGATCFFHERTPAQVVCEGCGRFVCMLCSLDVPQPANNPPNFPGHLCPNCFAHQVESETKSASWDLFQTTYPRYDIMAVLLATVPLALFPLFILTPLIAPLALFLIFRYWHACRTPLGRYRLNFVIAFLMVGITVFLWVSLFSVMVFNLSGDF